MSVGPFILHITLLPTPPLLPGQRKPRACCGWEEGSAHPPSPKTTKTKAKKKKKRQKKTALPCWPSACLFVWQHNLWLSLRYCWSQANSLHRKSGSQEQAIIQAGREKMLQGKVLKKGKGRWEDSETERKKNDNKRWESRGGRAQADTVKAGDGKWQERRDLKKQKQKKVGIKKGRHVNKRLWWRQACRTKKADSTEREENTFSNWEMLLGYWFLVS